MLIISFCLIKVNLKTFYLSYCLYPFVPFLLFPVIRSSRGVNNPKGSKYFIKVNLKTLYLSYCLFLKSLITI